MTFAPDPRFEKHEFQPAGWNHFFCGYCSNPKPTHRACGHAFFATGCETCGTALFSKQSQQRRRIENLEAMRHAGIGPASMIETITGGKVSLCRFCRSEVLWTTMVDSGKKNPIDVAPHPNGNIVLVGGTNARALTATEIEHYKAAGNRFYRSHLQTCTKAECYQRNRTRSHKLRVIAQLGGK